MSTKIILKIFTVCILALVAIISAASICVLNVTRETKFDTKKLNANKDTTIFFDTNEEKISNCHMLHEYVKINELPLHVKQSFIAIEDKRFYNHKGLDYKRIIGAAINNFKSKRLKEGASTISQQLIKNTHLSNEKTLKRKLKELKLTKELEKHYSKDEILEMYLNTIYFGENAYGIENASMLYFNKPASKLEIHESATLAGIIKAPSTYSPYTNPEKATSRRNLTLKCMTQQGYISKEQFETAKKQPMATKRNKTVTGNSYYLACARNETEEILKNTPYTIYDSLKIYTYYNKNLSDMISKEIEDQIPDCGYCIMLIDNKTNGANAIITDTGLTKRCPASTVKPWLVYAPAIEENKITIANKILDSKTDFNGFYPRNYGDIYHGFISAKEALSKSLNVPSVKIANLLGLNTIKQYASKMNITTEDGLGIALGNINEGLTLKQTLDCYSVFSHEGNFTQSSFIKKITTPDGKVIYNHTPKTKRVFSDGTAYIINDALLDCCKNGTAKKITNDNICAKTGTNGNKYGNIDAYTVSYTPKYTLGVWLGNADNSLMNNNISGGTYPAIISNEIWKNINSSTSIETFKMPNSVISVKINKELYDNDCILEYGNGPSFLFLKGTEPKIKLSINGIKQNIQNGLYTLSFQIIGYDGAEIYLNTTTKNELISNEQGNSATIRKALTSGKYYASIRPYTIDTNGNKRYGSDITLPYFNYQSEEIKSPPNTNEWWTPD